MERLWGDENKVHPNDYVGNSNLVDKWGNSVELEKHAAGWTIIINDYAVSYTTAAKACMYLNINGVELQ